MSTGKRLAKRSIIGTRVCALGDNGMYHPGVIQAVKTPAPFADNSNCIQLTPNTRYTVKFDSKEAAPSSRGCREYRECELIGPGFRSVTGVRLSVGQRVFLTYNGREIAGHAVCHRHEVDEVIVAVQPAGHEGSLELCKRLDEVRLLESRKSARLMDQDTDFARLADMAGDRKRQASHTIDVPAAGATTTYGSRKRRPSSSQDETAKDAMMDECNAALVLMSLSCSPHSPNINACMWGGTSPGGSSSSASWRSGSPSPSPPLSEEGSSTAFWSRATPPPSAGSDEGIGLDYDELPRKKKANRVVFRCTWPGCQVVTGTCALIEAHVRSTHLGDVKPSDHEEEFYYTEMELMQPTSSPPTMSHRDMARPPHEDPEYQRQIVGSIRQGLLAGQAGQAGPINIPAVSQHHFHYHQLPSSPQKLLKLSPRPASSYPYPSTSSASPPALLALSAGKAPVSPSRRLRGENKKCRKVYGMEHREQWCTQCKWKKACTRFGD